MKINKLMSAITSKNIAESEVHTLLPISCQCIKLLCNKEAVAKATPTVAIKTTVECPREKKSPAEILFS